MQKKAKEAGNKRAGPPGWMLSLMKFGWNKKISPFGVLRTVGRNRSLKGIGGFVENRSNIKHNGHAEIVRDYMYQILLRPGTTEYAILVSFGVGLVCHLPLESVEKLADPNFPIPVSFIYGDNDWVTNIEGEAPLRVAEANPD